jgi:hypothetical protein
MISEIEHNHVNHPTSNNHTIDGGTSQSEEARKNESPTANQDLSARSIYIPKLR